MGEIVGREAVLDAQIGQGEVEAAAVALAGEFTRGRWPEVFAGQLLHRGGGRGHGELGAWSLERGERFSE